MKKQGYLIAKNNLKEAYFTSSSSYDRPTWIKPDIATCYQTVELAESALRKLLKNGSFSARLVPIDEAISFELPDDKAPQVVPPMDPNQVPPNPDEEGGEDEDDENGEEGDMIAKDQTGDPEAAPIGDGHPGDEEIEAEVDQLLGNESDPALANTDDVNPETGDAGAAQPEIDPLTGEPIVPADGEEDLSQDGGDPALAVTGADDELGDEEQDPLAVRENANLSIKAIPILAVNKADVVADDSECDTKCKIPSDVLSALAGVKAEYARQSKFAGNNDDHKSFALTVVGAMEELHDLLQQGTVHGVKMAGLKMTSLMSPIMHLIPDNVVKFISMGGRKPTLQDLFNIKRFDKKSK